MSWTEDDRDESPTVLRYHPGQRLFNRYVLEYSLARGGMGVVWLAHDEVLDRRIALKFLPDRVRTDPASLDHLKREAQKSIQLSHHHIVKIHDFVPDAESPAISMEYVDGDTLSDLRKAQTHKVFEVDDLRPKLRQLCAALEYAHETVEIVHRDLKPSNLLINRRGQLKVADFGIASSLAPVTGKSQAERGGGTPGYMSPQQAGRQSASVLDDIYSLGATIYDLLTSRPPFYSEDKKQVVAQMPGDTAIPMEERRQRLRIRGEAIPRRWEEVVAACLAYDPAARPQSVRELAELLGLSDATTRPAMLAPEPPSGLRAKAADQRVILTWQESPAAAAYNLKRSQAAGGPHALIATVGATTSYADSGLRNDVTYYYVIEAVNAVGVSPPSEEVHAQPKAPPLPVAGMSTAIGDQQVSLSWLPAPGVQGYLVKRATTSGGPYVTIANVTSGTRFQDVGLENGKSYFYTVQAMGEAGVSAPSQEVCVVPCLAPVPPTGLTLEVGDCLIRLAWKPVPAAVAYHVLRSDHPGGPHTRIATVSATTNYADSGLHNDVTYYYVIEAVNAVGISTPSEEVCAQPKAPPLPVAGLSAVIGDRQVAFVWLPAPGAQGYMVKRASTSGGPYVTIANVTSGTRFQDVSLENGKSYFYTVQAMSEAGVSAPSQEICVVPCPAPVPPTGLTLEVGDRWIRLAWKSVPGAVAYHVLRSRHPGGPYTQITTLEEKTNFEDKGLENGVTYYYVLESLNASGCSPHSGEAHGSPQPIPQRPAGLRVEPGDREVLLSWAGAAFATSYEVSRAPAREGPYETIATVNTGTSFLDAPLENFITYYYRVQAVNVAGVSAASRDISARPRPPWNLAKAVGRVVQESLLPKLRATAKVAGAALVMALVAWLAVNFWWVRQGIHVETLPPGATLIVDGEPAGVSPLKKKLPAGRHELEVRLEGFEPEKREVQIPTNRVVRLAIPLNRSTGTLQVTALPEGKYRYQIKDQQEVVKTGITPEVVKLPSGRYSVEVMRPDWPSHVEAVVLQKDPRIVRADFSPVLLRVTSDPPGAEILHDGRLLKTTPADLALPPQHTELVARYPGLRDKQQTVTLERGKTNTTRFIFDYGGVIVQSDPVGARVRLAGTVQELGKTPYTNLVVAEGKAEYLLQLGGYTDRAVTVQVVRGKTAPVKVSLEPHVKAVGQMLVLTRPSDAVVYLNGTPAGQSGVTIPNLTPGKYRVRVELEGFEPEEFGDTIVGTNLTANVGPIKLKPSQGGIQVVSSPTGLNFELLDQRNSLIGTGVTGTTLQLTTGVYVVQVNRPDWPKFIQKVTLERNRTNLIRAEFASGQVEVISDPPKAEIWWMNQRRGMAPVTIELPVGQTTLEARYPGLTEKYETVVVEKDKLRKVSMEFDYGSVVVTSEPKGAAVFDTAKQKLIGQTPLTNQIIQSGKVSYRLSLDHYRGAVVEGMVDKRARRPLALHANLSASAGYLLVTTEPPGAEIILGDKRMGSNPLIPDLPAGRYALKIALRDYDLYESEVTIRENETNRLNQIKLIRSIGALRVDSLPAGAEFRLLGRELKTPRVGKTPGLVRDLPTGQYTLSVSKGPWKLPPESLTVRKGETNDVQVKLPFGTVKVATTPPGADLWLDGNPATNLVTPLILNEVKEGEIQLTLRLKGHQPVTITTNVVRQEELKVTVALREVLGPDRREPWTNSLGMVFVPLGENHICVTECRRRDYDTFIKETGYRSGDKWQDPGFKQDGSHPVVYVSCQDAQEFCRWLTERERRLGDKRFRLEQQFYRLPTDLEWSQAVGLTGETGATAWDRNEQVKGVFPWGTIWPPPVGAGNLHFAASFDDYVDTSPAGLFVPNRLGICDLSGNVWEWCEDWADATQKLRVLRGGSYKDYQPHMLTSSYRRLLPPNERLSDLGFRCVIDSGLKLAAKNAP